MQAMVLIHTTILLSCFLSNGTHRSHHTPTRGACTWFITCRVHRWPYHPVLAHIGWVTGAMVEGVKISIVFSLGANIECLDPEIRGRLGSGSSVSLLGAGCFVGDEQLVWMALNNISRVLSHPPALMQVMMARKHSSFGFTVLAIRCSINLITSIANICGRMISFFWGNITYHTNALSMARLATQSNQ